jgi:hypothetical protein
VRRGGKTAVEIAEEVLIEVRGDIAEREQKLRDRGYEMNFGIIRQRDVVRVEAHRVAPDAPWEITASVMLWERTDPLPGLELVADESGEYPNAAE